ncbi:TolC family outer membrane protein [Falsiroseomonas sp. HW251]|uniref:TolC family outer membrane protein n=1 Tax=Falsiroseomonas sp. HW251 TaxID=3390998 RepID=UPI003D3121D9
MTPSRFAIAGVLLASTAIAEIRPAAGQTLQEALAMAYANNPTLQAARANLRAVDENVPQALAGWRPTVQITGSGGQQTSSAVGTPTQGGARVDTPWRSRDIYTVQGSVTQPIYRGGRTTAQTRRAENQVLAQRARLLATEQQVLQDAVTAYVQVIQLAEEVRLNTNNVQVLTRQLQATNERFRVGEITRTDVAQAESRLAGAIASRADSEGRLQQARATFTRVVGQPPQRLSPPQPLRQVAATSQQAAALASANNPNVVAALFDEAAARDNIDIQFSNLMPQVSLNGSVFRQDNQTTDGLRQNGTQVTANLTMPLYQGGAEYSLVRQARQQAQQARQVVEDQRRTASQQATQAYETLVSARAQVEANRAQIRAAEIALDGVQREAIVGSRTTLDVLNAEQELLNARVALVRGLAALITASHNLAVAVGRLTARDLTLPVEVYDPEAYYRAVRDRWAGWGETDRVSDATPAR